MLADIVEGLDPAIGLPDDQDGLAPNLLQHEVAGFGNLVGADRDQPAFGPDIVPLRLHEGARRVAIAAKGAGRAGVDSMRVGHATFLSPWAALRLWFAGKPYGSILI